MSEPKFTPGKWIVREFNGKRFVVTDRPDEKGLFVGQLIATETTAPECRENLDAISALPDLHAALGSLLSAVQNMRNCQTVADVGLLVLKFSGPIEASLAALAKAEGGAR